MKNFYLHLSLIVTLILLFFVSNIFIASSLNYWYVTPSVYVNVVLLVIAIALVIYGMIKRTSNEQLFYGIGISIFLVTTAVLLSISAFFSPLEKQQLLETVQSPEKTHTLEVYLLEKEVGTFNKTFVYEQGPLWTKRLVYLEDEQENATITWNSEDEVKINDTILNLSKNETIFLNKELEE